MIVNLKRLSRTRGTDRILTQLMDRIGNFNFHFSELLIIYDVAVNIFFTLKISLNFFFIKQPLFNNLFDREFRKEAGLCLGKGTHRENEKEICHSEIVGEDSLSTGIQRDTKREVATNDLTSGFDRLYRLR